MKPRASGLQGSFPSLDELLAMAQSGAPLAGQTGPRSRRRAARAAGSGAVIAAAFIAEGCKTVGRRGVSLEPEAPRGGAASPPPAPAPPPATPPAPPPAATTAYAVEEAGVAPIAVSELLGSTSGASLVAVVAAENGTAALSGAVVHFTPAAGYAGPASITFTYRDADGMLKSGSFKLTVDDEAAAAQGHHSLPVNDGAHAGHEGPSGHGAAAPDGRPIESGAGAPHGEHENPPGAAPEAPPAGEASPENVGEGEEPAGHDHPGAGAGEESEESAGGAPPPAPSGGQPGAPAAPSGGGGHQHGGGAGDPPHPDDPAKASEHMALLNLAPVADATHVAIKNGSWFDAATWSTGAVPGADARVVIPSGVAVAYDGESPASIFTIRVDGALTFATDRDTFLEVDTLIVAPTGKLTIGTAANPVAAGVEAVISIADNGPIDVAWDPQLLSRGVVSHGTVEIHGAEKDSHLKVAVDPMAGATSLVLAEAPEGWRVGDKIVLAGTHKHPLTVYESDVAQQFVSEDEELIITAIDGATIHFDRPLQFDHDTPRPDLKTSVANYTRNVRIETENADSVPVHQRGHTMFMHSDEIDIRYAEFNELGRTDKSVRAFDLDDLVQVAPDSNLKGRYSLHIHRAGVSDLDDPAMLVGNAVWGSPGWGFVHHDSNAILANNAAYDVFGAAFVAELGTEVGRWTNNISIHTTGVGNSDKHASDVAAFDLGRNGAGFWFQGRMVEAVDNIAAGAGGAGFVYAHRAPLEMLQALDPSVAPDSDRLRYLDTAFVDKPNIGKFVGNETFAAEGGLHVVKQNAAQEHDVRSVIENFTAWEVRNGVEFEYTAHYTILGLDVVGAAAAPGAGVVFGTDAHDMVVNGAHIEGFQTGVFDVKQRATGEPWANFHHFFIDVEFAGVTTPWHNVAAGEILSGASLVDREVTYQSAFGVSIPVGPWHPNNPPLLLEGTKTDSLGTTASTIEVDPFVANYWVLRGAVEQNGYWTTTDGKYVTLIEEYVSDRATGDRIKVGIFVELPTTLYPTNPHHEFTHRFDVVNNGVLDPNSAAPVAGADHVTVKAGHSIVIDVLANDHDPEGGDIDLDGLYTEYGYAVENDDGTVTYFADRNQSGDDVIYYWVEDDQGNFTKGVVHVNVEA